MSSAITILALVTLALAAGFIWERLRLRYKPAKGAHSPGETEAPDAGKCTVIAYSFQSDLSFKEAAGLLGAAEGFSLDEFGDWYERDSAWYSELLSCRSHRGIAMNLYFFDDEKVLELKFRESDTARAAAENFALKELLPALGARQIKPTQSVD